MPLYETDLSREAKQFLVVFDKELSVHRATADEMGEKIDEEAAFGLFQHEGGTRHTVIGREIQQRFKFQVFKRYGTRCAVCGLEVLALLQAAHILLFGVMGAEGGIRRTLFLDVLRCPPSVFSSGFAFVYVHNCLLMVVGVPVNVPVSISWVN